MSNGPSAHLKFAHLKLTAATAGTATCRSAAAYALVALFKVVIIDAFFLVRVAEVQLTEAIAKG